MKICRDWCSSEEAQGLFEFLMDFKLSDTEAVSWWVSQENGRKNKKYFFFKPQGINTLASGGVIHRLRTFDETYKSPFGPQNIGSLERIQVVESIESKVENSKGDHVYKFHVDRVNTYKQILLCSEVTIDCGPFQVASIDECREKALTLHADLGRELETGDWRNFDATIDCDRYESCTGHSGDLIVVDGREPHRAGKINPGFSRKLIIFEYMTREASRVYRQDLAISR